MSRILTDHKGVSNEGEDDKLRALVKWLGLSYQDFSIERRVRAEEWTPDDLLEVAGEFARADRSGAFVDDYAEEPQISASDLALSCLASAALGSLAARAQSGNEMAQRLFFDTVCNAAIDFETLAFQDLATFKQRARKRSEIPAMTSRIKGSHRKTERLLELLEQGEDCPRPGLDGQAKAFTAMPWLVTALRDDMEGFRRSPAIFVGACTPLDEIVQSFVSLPDLNSKSVECWIAASWSWLLRSTGYERLGDHTQVEAEERHLYDSDLFKAEPLNDKPARLRKAFNSGWCEMAAAQEKLTPKSGDSSARQ